jgi:hypothetical protein
VPSRLLTTDRTYVDDWRSYYPSGIPHNYNVIHEPGSKQPEFYTELYVLAENYANPPADSAAIFSTDNGKLDKRAVVDPSQNRRMRLWSASLIQDTCNSIRKRHWTIIRDLVQPQDPMDLFHYFDAHDIYEHGFLNLWNVVNHLYFENKNIYKDATTEMYYEIGAWIASWVDEPGNHLKLINFHETDIISVFSEDEKDELRKLKDESLVLTRCTLTHHADLLRANTWAEHRQWPESCLEAHWLVGQIHLWLGKSPYPPLPAP